MLQALIDSVATEPGFPSYADYHAAPAALPPSPDTAPAAYPPSPDTAPGLYGPSGFGRACGGVRVRVRVRTLTLTLTLTLIPNRTLAQP